MTGTLSRNGLHLVTKDAPLVTICSHKPRDAPRDTPGGGDTGPAGKTRWHPGREAPASTARCAPHPHLRSQFAVIQADITRGNACDSASHLLSSRVQSQDPVVPLV